MFKYDAALLDSHQDQVKTISQVFRASKQSIGILLDRYTGHFQIILKGGGHLVQYGPIFAQHKERQATILHHFSRHISIRSWVLVDGKCANTSICPKGTGRKPQGPSRVADGSPNYFFIILHI